MQRRNPINGKPRKSYKLVQAKPCFANHWVEGSGLESKAVGSGTLELVDSQNPPLEILNTTRLGIPKGRTNICY